MTRGDKGFADVWQLIESNALVELPKKEPKYIMRLGVKNAPYSPWINNSQYVLIPDSTPIIVGYCNELDPFNPKCNFNDAIVVGTVGDFKLWKLNKQNTIRTKFTLILSISSILLGLILLFKGQS